MDKYDASSGDEQDTPTMITAAATTGAGRDDHGDSDSEGPVERRDPYQQPSRRKIEDDRRSRTSWEENDSEGEEPYKAYDYGHMDDEDDFEERPRSHQQSKQRSPPQRRYSSTSESEYKERPRSQQQQQKSDPHQRRYSSASENEFEKRPRSQQQQKSDQHQRQYSSASENEHKEPSRSPKQKSLQQQHRYSSSASKNEYEERRPRSQQQQQESDQHHDSTSENEFEERSRSQRQQKPDQHQRGYDSASENEYEKRPHSQQQQQQKSDQHQRGYDSASENEFEERPRSERQQKPDQHQRGYDSASENEFEERPRSQQQQQKPDQHQHGYDSASENEFEERPRSQRQQKPDEHQHGYDPASENEFEERPRSQQQQQKPDQHQHGYDSASENEFEERPRSQRQQKPDEHQHGYDPASENEFEERPRSQQQQKPDQHQRGYDSTSENEFEERPRSQQQQRKSDQHQRGYDSASENEYEKRPHSQQQQQKSDQHQRGYDSTSENEFEERPRSQQQQQKSDQHQRGYDSVSENEYEKRPHSQQQQQQKSDQHQRGYDSTSENEFEERPRSQQQQEPVQHQRGYDSASENEFEERPRSQRQQKPDEHQHGYDPASENEFEERPRSQQQQEPVQHQRGYDSAGENEFEEPRSQQQQQKPDQHQRGYDSASESEFEERPRSQQQQMPDQHQRGYDSASGNEFEESRSTHLQRAKAYSHSSENEDDFEERRRSTHQQKQPLSDQQCQYSSEDEGQVLKHNQEKKVADKDLHDHNHGHAESHRESQRGRHSTDSNRRPSFDDDEKDNPTTGHPVSNYDEMGEPAAPNHHMFRNNDVDHRASVKSAKSFSSQDSKNHSLGYNGRSADYDERSESESESESSKPVQPLGHDTSSAKTRPISSFSHTSIPTPASPTHARSAGVAITDVHHGSVTAAATVAAVASTATPATPTTPAAPATSATSAPAPVSESMNTPMPQSPRNIDTISQVSASSASSMDQSQKRYSFTGSDTSGTSIDIHSPTLKGHLKIGSLFNRPLPSRPDSRETTSNNGSSFDRPRPISYASVFSDTELNDVNLMDDPVNEKRASEVVPPTPSTPSAFSFASVFGRSQPAPQQPTTVAQATAPVTPATPTPAAIPSDPRNRSTSFSTLASTIQGAFSFSRGFSQTPSPVPRTPSRESHQVSHSSRPSVNTVSDHRVSSNRSRASERESTISTATTDSSVDLLLARLEAQNELLEQDSRRRATTDSEMDRAIGQAKAESAGEDIDWEYWGALMHDYNGVAKRNPRQLTAMIQKGVPPSLRGQIWQLFAKSKEIQLEEKFVELLKSTSTHEKQITRDLSRTFPNHEYFQTNGAGQEALFNVVKAYSLYDTEVGYCQGLSFVVGPLLLNMPEDEAFSMLVRMMNTYEMRGHYTPDMSELQLRLFQFEQLMEDTIPLVFKHLRNQGVRSTMYASQWFMTLFAYKFPLDLVFRVFDIILVEGIESILRFAIALLKASHDKILNLDFEVLVEFLKNGLFEHYMDDAGLFIQDAFNVKVTPRTLAQYTQRYQAMLQKQQAELVAEESLRETNRQLSAQVRGLETSLNQLNKEHIDLAKELITRKVEMAQLQDKNDMLTRKAKEAQERCKREVEGAMQFNMETLKKNEELEDQLGYMESLLVETKMKYAESEIERDALTRTLSDMKKALAPV